MFRKTYKSVYDSIKPNEKLLENIISGNVKRKKPYYRQIMSVAAALIIIAGASTAYPLLVQKPTVEETTVVQEDKVNTSETETIMPEKSTAEEDIPVPVSEPVQENMTPQPEAAPYVPTVTDKPTVAKAEKTVTDEVKAVAETTVSEDIPTSEDFSVSEETKQPELPQEAVVEAEEVSTEETAQSVQTAEETEEGTDDFAAGDMERVAFKVNSPTGCDAEAYIKYIGFDFRKYLNLPDKMADTTENGQIIPDEENPVDNGHFTFCGENDSLVEFFVTKNGGFAQTYEDTVSKQYGSNTAYWLGSDTSFTVKFSRNDIYFMVVSYGLTETELEEMISGLITEN